MSEPIPLAVAEAQERRQRANRRAAALMVHSSSLCRLDRERRYLLKGLIYPAELSVWYGPPGCGKTFLAQYIAHSIERGRAVFGRRVSRASTLYLALEGESGFRKRMAALTQVGGEAPNLFFYAQPLNLFSDGAAIAGVIDAVRERSIELLVVDTLSRSMSGGNENAPDDMTQMIGIFDRIRAETSAHVMVIHHTGKDIDRGGRGHTSLKGAADVEVEVKRAIGGARSLRVVKARDDSDGHSHGFRLKVIDLGTDADGDAITTCVVEECDAGAENEGPEARLSKGTLQALDWLREAIAEYGEPAPAGLPMVRVITKDKWIFVGKKRTTETTDDAVRRAIARAITHLTVAKLIAVSAPHIWLMER